MGVKIGDKYQFIDQDYKKVFGEYDDVVPFSCGYAGIKEGTKWFVIDTTGQKLFENGHDGIIAGDDEIAFVNNRCFVIDGSKVTMINFSGETIGNGIYEDAMPFSDSGYAAVKVGGKWGFVDSNGNMIIEPQYEGARSFSNGKAAICQDGLWGYINQAGEEVLECQFTDVRDVTDSLTAFVCREDRWIVIKFYM